MLCGWPQNRPSAHIRDLWWWQSEILCGSCCSRRPPGPREFCGHPGSSEQHLGKACGGHGAHGHHTGSLDSLLGVSAWPLKELLPVLHSTTQCHRLSRQRPKVQPCRAFNSGKGPLICFLSTGSQRTTPQEPVCCVLYEYCPGVCMGKR